MQRVAGLTLCEKPSWCAFDSQASISSAVMGVLRCKGVSSGSPSETVPSAFRCGNGRGAGRL